jgi:uncharacterized membrane protein YqhA
MAQQQLDPTAPRPAPELPKLLRFIAWTRLISVIAVISSLSGSLLMFMIGGVNTVRAFQTFLFSQPEVAVELDVRLIGHD